jgi:hypothetical protein
MPTIRFGLDGADCLGVRVRDLPISRDKLIAAMEPAS